MRTGRRIIGIAAGGLLAAGMFAAPAYASSRGPVPSDCTVTTSGNVWSMNCTQRPPTQVWNMEVECWASMLHEYVPVQGSQVTGNGTSTVNFCPRGYVDTFVIDS